jgi:hypothetical protein
LRRALGDQHIDDVRRARRREGASGRGGGQNHAAVMILSGGSADKPGRRVGWLQASHRARAEATAGERMRKVLVWASLLAVVSVVGLGAYWALELRWRPRTIERDRAEIERLLESAGWVSPGLPGPTLYMLSFRTCPDCIRYKETEFPKLQAAQVDTRVIVYARPDTEGIANSTPAERATVAQLWSDRPGGWALLQRWMTTPPSAWTAPGIAPADGDVARTAIVERGRSFIDQMEPLLERNGSRSPSRP